MTEPADAAPGFDRYLARQTAIRKAFSPGAPVDKKDLFAGRVEQLLAVLDVMYERGRHAVVYGERGVGKTSLALIAAGVGNNDGFIVAKANCQTGDRFGHVIARLFSKIPVNTTTQQPGFLGGASGATEPASNYFFGGKTGGITSDQARLALDALSYHAPVTLILDEYDRLDDTNAHHVFADLVKGLSDDSAPVTLIFVGVADDVHDLISEHLSIERNLKQIEMPRMSQNELADAIVRGMKECDMQITDAARDRITPLAQGLPHYAHLVAQAAAMEANDEDETVVNEDHVSRAITSAINQAQESVTKAYHKATFSSQVTNLYKEVLLACACAQGDERGFFTAAAVREPMSAIMGKPYEIPAFAKHLNALSADARGPVLRKEGEKKNFGYRFINPLLQPYVMMRGVADRLITQDQLDAIHVARAGVH